MAVTLTENAAKKIWIQLAKRGKGIGLFIGVKKVGCSGLAYTFDIADEIRAGDHTFESHNAPFGARCWQPGGARWRAYRFRHRRAYSRIIVFENTESSISS